MTSDSTELPSQRLAVQENDAGARLDAFVARELALSRARAKALLQTAKVNGKREKPSYLLKAGDVIMLEQPQAQDGEKRADAGSHAVGTLPPVIYEDDSLIILDKPRGLVVHEGAGETGSTLVDLLRGHGKQLSSFGPAARAGIVHRLDKDTSGVIAVCKTEEAHQKLAEEFAERRVVKEYFALVCGTPQTPGRIEAPIERHPKNRRKMAVSASGRMAITEYFAEKSWSRFTLLKVKIITGRTHQIRVHLSYLNHPVVGDELYGGLHRALENAPGEAVKSAMESLEGQALHASCLRFTHPTTGEEVEFRAALPADFSRLIAALNEREV